MDGVFIIDKPSGMSSAKVVAQVKKIVGAAKAGHTGTLDPFATGVLLCCIGQATRLSQFFLHSSKTYEAVIRLGIETDTQDLTGNITATYENFTFSEHSLLSVLKRFEGETEQQPPAYSALKHQGVPLYKLARAGKSIVKPPRKIYIENIRLLNMALTEIQISVSCSAGTYIRTLASDIGRELKCGAHLKALRRTESSGFSIQDAVTLEDLNKLASQGNDDECLISMSEALKHMPAHRADEVLTQKIMNGKLLSVQDIPIFQDNGNLKVIDRENRLIAVLSFEKDAGRYGYCCVFQQE